MGPIMSPPRDKSHSGPRFRDRALLMIEVQGLIVLMLHCVFFFILIARSARPEYSPTEEAGLELLEGDCKTTQAHSGAKSWLISGVSQMINHQNLALGSRLDVSSSGRCAHTPAPSSALRGEKSSTNSSRLGHDRRVWTASSL